MKAIKPLRLPESARTAYLSTSTRRWAVKHSPWGVVQDSRPIADGLRWVSTPGHGGIELSLVRWLQLESLFPSAKCQRYAPVYWLEEDCDWVYAALTFPELFSDQEMYYAVRTVRGPSGCDDAYFAFAREWLKTNGLALIARHDKWEASVADKWERGSYGSAPKGYASGCWSVGFDRAGVHRSEVISCYPDAYYTDEQLKAVIALPLPKKEMFTVIEEFNPNDCGGAFDGFRVTSDADPGL